MKREFLWLLLCVATGCVAASPRDRVIDYWALYYAAKDGNEQLVEALLDRGAPVDALGPDAAGNLSYLAIDLDSPLQVAAANGNVKIVRMLLTRKPWIDHRCCTTPAALGLATDAGHTEVVRLLLEAGADPSVKSDYGDPAKPETPLEVAQRKGHTEITQMLKAAKRPSKP